MSYGTYEPSVSSRPDRPLVVKCTFDRWNKRITFSSARNCSYELLRNKVEQCFSLSAFSYTIAYKDDDGEVTDITTESDLTEAIQYFQAGVDDFPSSSAASILSVRSFGNRKITLRVHINVDYDGPSLSDTSSLASMEEYKDRNRSEFSLSFSSSDLAIELDDDSVTVSSRDTGSLAARPTTVTPRIGAANSIPRSIPSALQEISTDSGFDSSSLANYDGHAHSSINGSVNHGSQISLQEDPSAVFERLKRMESINGGSSSSPLNSNLSTQWLREQSTIAMNGIVGPTTMPSAASSISDGASLSIDGSIEQSQDQSALDGDLALQRDLRGKYYYTYTAGSSGTSQSHDSGYEESVDQDGENVKSDGQANGSEQSQDWYAQQEQQLNIYTAKASSFPSSSRPSVRSTVSDPLPRDSMATTHMYPDDIPPEVLQFLSHTPRPPVECTDCSECGVELDSFRYVCSTCGEKTPKPKDIFAAQQQQWTSVTMVNNDDSTYGKGKGKEFEPNGIELMSYPPASHRSPRSTGSDSSWSLLSDGDSSSSSYNKPLPPKPKPLPQLPTQSLSLVTAGYSPALNNSPTNSGGSDKGYELCVSCIEHAGVTHALSESGGGPGPAPGSHSLSSSPNTTTMGGDMNGNSTPPSPEETLSQWRRSAPKRKGHFRHAYIEKVWGHEGWKNVEHDDISHCSICNNALISQRYKCASCPKFNLCRGCYSQVHEIHPSHAFLIVLDTQQQKSRSEPDLSLMATDDGLGERSMTHLGVKCAHCLLDIVGARFHCAICDSVDICSNCESAGLPGNLDAPDGGHNSSHIMIKIPFPLKSAEVQTASRRALHLWTGRDAPNVQQRSGGDRVRANSVLSDMDTQTVIGSRNGRPTMNRSTSGASESRTNGAHRLFCNGCSNPILGVRFQCATCPSSPTSYSLCAKCETRSYVLHDPMHTFFKLPRPVDQPIASRHPLVPILYRDPAGPTPGTQITADPRGYLHHLCHQAAVCDRCFELIRGPWYHCVYCAKDFCEDCETIDAHDPTHFFLVFKSNVDMQLYRLFADPENPRGSPPVLQYPVYLS